jgi:hypothetical protein
MIGDLLGTRGGIDQCLSSSVDSRQESVKGMVGAKEQGTARISDQA